MSEEIQIGTVRGRTTGYDMTMSRVMPGLHRGEDLRAERVDGLWQADTRMRDVGALAFPPQSTGLHEYHPDGGWTPMGRFRTLRLAEVARDMLKEGTHLVRAAHAESCGSADIKVAAHLVPYAEARRLMIDWGLVDDFTPSADGDGAPAPR